MSAPIPVATDGDDAHLDYSPDPAMPGWMKWDVRDDSRFNATLGMLRVRREGERGGRMRMWPTRRHTNFVDTLHGGAMMALIDISLFSTCRVNGIFPVGLASTLDLSVQFIAPGRADVPLDAVAEVLRETGRLVFLRGLVVQEGDGDTGDTLCCAFSGTVRKPPR